MSGARSGIEGASFPSPAPTAPRTQVALDALADTIRNLPAEGFRVFRVRLTDERVTSTVMRALGVVFEAIYDDELEEVARGTA
jgi:hypothetical protein